MNFLPESLYHVYNRGNNQQVIFFEEENYRYFLRKVKISLTPYCDILAYCLMPNHFHFLVYTKLHKKEEIYKPSGWHNAIHPLAKSLGTLTSSYCQALNKRLNRTGSLFQQKTKSKLLDGFENPESYPLNCFEYIHNNPVEAGFCNRPGEWKFSSYREYSGQDKEFLVNKNLAFRLLPLEGVVF